MNIEEFANTYYLKFYKRKIQSFYHFTTELVDKQTHDIIDVQQTMKEESELDRTFFPENFYASNPLSLDAYVGKIRRFQFSLFSSMIPIDGFNPLDEEVNPNLDHFYKK